MNVEKKIGNIQNDESNPNVLEILRLENITKTFLGGKIIANNNISISFKRSNIHAIVGENGSGKSTLMNIIFGLYKQDQGDIFINNKLVDMFHSGSAKKHKIGMVHQHFNIVEDFTVLENVILGQEEADDDKENLVGKFGFLNKKEILKRFQNICKKYHINIDPNKKVNKLSVGKRQMVEILKVLWISKDIIVFDEPTATLSVVEIQDLLKTINSLKKEGKTIIFISHKLDEVKEIADEISVLKKGNFMGTYFNDEKITTSKIAKLMVGKQIKLDFPERKIDGPEILKLDKVSYVTSGGFKALDNISFSIKEGEVFGLAGIEGNGQEQIMELVSGLKKITNGKITWKGQVLFDDKGNKMDVSLKNTLMSHIPIDRYKHGIVKELSLKYNSMITTFDSPDFSKLWSFKTKDKLLKNKLINLSINIGLLEEQLQNNLNTKKIINLQKKLIQNDIQLLELNLIKSTKKEISEIKENIFQKKLKLNDLEKNIPTKKELLDTRSEEVILKELIKYKTNYKKLSRKVPIRNYILDTSSSDAWTNKIVNQLNVEGAFENSIPISNLSGGNQQKFVVGREVLRAHEIILAGHPTRGLDISAINHIYKKILQNSVGKATLLYSLEISELVAVCDRIAILYKGKIVKIINPKKTNMDKISKMMIGVVK